MAIPRGYVRIRQDSFTSDFRLHLKTKLTIVPAQTSSFKTNAPVIRLYEEDGDWIGVPRGFFLKFLSNQILKWEFLPSLGKDVEQCEQFGLREGQAEVIEEAYQTMMNLPFGGAIIEAKTGAGKTALGCEMARRLCRKTLVVVHTTVLMKQWAEEIQKFLPQWKIGRIQADEINTDGKDICIGMLQSLAFKEYPEWLYDEFGTVVIDEVHVAGAPEFSKMFPRFPSKYMLGLSGTLERKDHAEDVFKFSIGPTVSGMDKIEVLKPKVYFVNTQFLWTPAEWASEYEIDRQKPMMLKKLTVNHVRNELIIRQTIKAGESGRNVLVLSDRVAQLEHIAKEIRERVPGISVGLLIGSKSDAERKKAQECQIICATVQLVGTGFNEPRMDTLMFASPIQSVEQPVGRVLRRLEGKREPIVVDLVDRNIKMCVHLARSRLRKYEAKGWEVFGADALRD